MLLKTKQLAEATCNLHESTSVQKTKLRKLCEQYVILNHVASTITGLTVETQMLKDTNGDVPKAISTMQDFLRDTINDFKTTEKLRKIALRIIKSTVIPKKLKTKVFKLRLKHGVEHVCPLTADIDCVCHVKFFGFHDYNVPNDADVVRQMTALNKYNNKNKGNPSKAMFEHLPLNLAADVVRFGKGPVLKREISNAKTVAKINKLLDLFQSAINYNSNSSLESIKVSIIDNIHKGC